MTHIRRINLHNNAEKKNSNGSLSCDELFYFPAPVETPDLKSDDQIQAEEAKKNVA
jgi:hypothetical protein